MSLATRALTAFAACLCRYPRETGTHWLGHGAGSGVWRLGRPRGTRSGAQNGVLSPAPNVNPDSEYRLPGRLQSEVRRPGLP